MSFLLHLFFVLPVLFFLNEHSKNEDRIAWSFQTSAPVVASPVISDGVIYIGGLDSTFYAIHAKTGKERWQFKTADEIRSSAACHKGMCYFESGNVLYAINRKGRFHWKAALCSGEVKNKLDPWDYHHSSPVVYEGVVYIGTEQGILLGIDAKSGKVVMRCQTISEQAIRTTPVISDGLVMYGDWDGVFYASRIENGSLLWKYDTKTDGTFPWVNAIQGSPVVHNGKVYFAGRSCRLYALDIRTGTKRWHYSSPTDQWLLGGPALTEGTLFLGSSDQRLFHAFDSENGELLWTTGMDGRTWGKAFVTGNQVYIGSNSFYVLQKSSGKVMQEYNFPQVHADKKYGEYVDRTANFHSSPLLFEHMAILGSDDGHVYAINLAD
jgi:outer membrane protein assembly factor BamB